MTSDRSWTQWGRRIRLPHSTFMIPATLAAVVIAVLAIVWMLNGSALPGRQVNSGPFPAELRIVTTSGEEILRIPLVQGPSWEVHWQHSVANILVRDRFTWRDGQMLLTDTRAPLLDVAGLGHTPGRGELRDDGNGGAWITAIDEAIPGNAYWIRIGSARAPTTLVYAGQYYPLSVDHPNVRARIEVILP
jgi:hypothetical protein